MTGKNRKDRPDWAQRLTEARESTGLSQRKFATMLGINQNTLVKYELGERDPGFSLVKKIIEITKVSPRWLLLGIGPKIDTGEVSVHTLFPNIPKDDRDSIKEMLEVMNSSRIYYHRMMMEWARVKIEIDPDEMKKLLNGNE
jgi:transcriptional regulator with XRE-family HTH domain